MSTNAAYYKILGLPQDASWEEVKRAFRKLARLYHPDVAGPEGAHRFSEITEAYMTLKEILVTVEGVPRREPIRQTGGEVRAEPVRAREAGGLRALLQALARSISGLFSFSRARSPEAEEDEEIPPSRLRFIGSVISRAEADIQTLMQRRNVEREKSRTQALLTRLQSRHPGVVLLALKSVPPRGGAADVRAVILRHFREHAPSAEILEALLRIFGSREGVRELSPALLPHARSYSPHDAVLLVRWFRHHAMEQACFVPFLLHESAAVVACALTNWPTTPDAVVPAEFFSLLRRPEEGILVPLLRILRKEAFPAWAVPILLRLARDDKSPAVRVWASAIVRDQNLS